MCYINVQIHLTLQPLKYSDIIQNNASNDDLDSECQKNVQAEDETVHKTQ